MPAESEFVTQRQQQEQSECADAVSDDGVSRAQADAAMAAMLRHIKVLPASQAVPLIGRYRTQLDAAEAASLASTIGDDGSTTTAERVAGKGAKTSKRTRRRAAKRAAAVKKNSGLVDKMASGDLSGEHVDLLADAAAKTDGASLTDEHLIADVGDVDPDQGKRVIEKFIEDTTNGDKAQSRHDRQRRKRRVSRFATKDDLEAILMVGDKATIDRIWNQTTRRSQSLYRSDGGRDLPNDQHPRTFDQRLFDAFTDHFATGPTNDDDSNTGPGFDCDPDKPPPGANA